MVYVRAAQLGQGSKDASSGAVCHAGELGAKASLAATTSFNSMEQITQKTQLLRLETIQDRETRHFLFTLKVVVVASMIIAITMCSIKAAAPHLIVLNQGYFIMELVWSSSLFVLLVVLVSVWGNCILASRRAGMQWSSRRRMGVRVASTRVAVVLVILGGRMAQNIEVLADPSAYCALTTLSVLLSFTITGAWNTFLFCVLMDAHSTAFVAPQEASASAEADMSACSPSALWRCCPWAKRPPAAASQKASSPTRQGAGRNHRRKVVADMPLSYHWRKMLLWLYISGLLVALALKQLEVIGSQPMFVITPDSGQECTWGADLTCERSSSGAAIGSLMLTGLGAYFVWFLWLLWRSGAQLARVPYQKYRDEQLMLRINTRVNGALMFSLVFGAGISWVWATSHCAMFTTSWYGTPCLPLVATVLAYVYLFLTTPRAQGSFNKYGRSVVPSAMLQEFAWTAGDVPRKLQRRNAAITMVHADIEHEPMFAVDTAIKLFFWSALVYDFPSSGDTFQNLPEEITALMGTVNEAMGLFGLSKHRVFYDKTHATKVVVAWGEDTVVVAARGSIERANFVADAKMRQVLHPPQRTFQGRVPRVHQGFWETWHASGVRARVLRHVSDLLNEIAEASGSRDAVRVLCTGHSLGGAVATLAAFDLQGEVGISPECLHLYTFGCPRVGNHAFAREFHEVVPNAWGVINDQDVVTRGMKMFGYYKRAGQRVVVRPNGDLIVRPTLFETAMLQRLTGGVVSQHQPKQYLTAMVAAVTRQLSEEDRQADGLHGLLGLLKSVPLVRTALERHAQQAGTTLLSVVSHLVATPGHPSEAHVGVTPSSHPTDSAAVYNGAVYDGAAASAHSHRLSASRRDSLLRAAGATQATQPLQRHAHRTRPSGGVATSGHLQQAPPNADDCGSDCSSTEAVVPVAMGVCGVAESLEPVDTREQG